MTLFLGAIFHSFFVGLVAFYSRNINRRWDIFEDDEMRRYVITAVRSAETDKIGIGFVIGFGFGVGFVEKYFGEDSWEKIHRS